SQRQLAFPGCSSAYISRIEAGMRTPSLQVLHLLAQRLDVTGDYLATGGAGATAEDDVLTQAEFALRFDDLPQAERLFKEVLDSAEDARARARALDGLGQLAFRKGDPRTTVERLEAALEAYGGDIGAHARLADTLGRAYAMLGDLGASVEIFDRCLGEARRRNDRLEASRFAMLLGHALIDAADFDEAQALLEETTALASDVADPLLHARLYWLESRLYAEQNDAERAARYARKALSIVEMTEDRAYVGRAHQLLAHIEIDRGRPADALDVLERGRSLIAEASQVEQAQYRLEEARALAALGESERAASLAMEVSGVIAGANVEDAGRSYTLLAELFASFGDSARAQELYELAAELLERNPNRYLVRVYRRHAELLESEGRADEAMDLLKKAVAIGEFEQPRLRLPRRKAITHS
ncbi:MAG TPA: tetratricopeptide repeat protein, partial [Gaiellaceae bacterium]|nr:tetratricopeptide repeat protein [Gaiellaceae bacterium]